MSVHVRSKGKQQRVLSRADWYRLFSADYAEGMTGTSIARKYGIGHSFVYDVLNDPTGAVVRKRKRAYGGKCESCGKRTDGSNGAKRAPKLCVDCTRQKSHDGRYWTPTRIIHAIQAFEHKHGRPPRATDWLYGDRDGGPAVTTVQREFGTWVAAVRTAGFDVPGVGMYERSEDTVRLLSIANTKAGFYWTNERIIEEIRRWAFDHDGKPPSCNQWMTACEAHPATSTVMRRFGGWNKAIAAAGFTPRKSGRMAA